MRSAHAPRNLLFLLTLSVVVVAPEAVASEPGYTGMIVSGTGRATGRAVLGRLGSTVRTVRSAGATLRYMARSINAVKQNPPGFLPLKLDGAELTPLAVNGYQIDYQLGRDNLGFVNPGGMMQLGGMSGNCYTMALVSKLFHEDGEFIPPAEGESLGKGVTLDQLASHLRAGRKGKIFVKGYSSLHDMTTDPDPTNPVDLEDRVHERVRRRAGLSSSNRAPEPLQGRVAAVTEAHQFIQAIHFSFFAQRSGHGFVRSTLAEQLGGKKAPRVITREQAESMKAELRAGRTALLCLWNNSVFFGHVILAYACVETADADYFICYDNNTQYGQETRPTIIRIGKKEHTIREYLRQNDGTLTGGISEQSEVVLHMPDLTRDPANLSDLEKIVETADNESAFLMASNDFIQSLTTVAPEKSSLLDDTKQFILNLQTIQQTLGLTGIAPEDRIDNDASLTQVNKVLDKYSQIAVRTAAPYGLPPGVKIENTRLQFRTGTEADVTATIKIEKDTVASKITRALENAGTFASKDVARWFGAVRETVGGEPIQARVKMSVSKGAGNRSIFASLGAAKAPYGPVPSLRRAHVVLGDLKPSSKISDPFALEISEGVAEKAVRAALGWHRLMGNWHRVDSDTKVRINDISLKFDNNVTVGSDVELFRAITSKTSGVRIQAKNARTRLFVMRRNNDPETVWRFRLDFLTKFTRHDGLAGLGNFAISTAMALFKSKVHKAVRAAVLDAQSGLNNLLKDDMSGHLTLFQPLNMDRGGQLIFHWGHGWMAAWTPKKIANFGTTGQICLDLAKLGSKLPGPAASYRIATIRPGKSRLIVTARPRREEIAAD